MQGAVGMTGAAGPIGMQGAQGPAGNTGPQGVMGVPGPQGAVGPTGAAAAWSGSTGTAGATGAGGFVQQGNLIDNWGSTNATTTGVAVTFARPYIDQPPAVTVSTGGAATPKVTAVTRTGFVLTGSGLSYWRAIGS
jgi:hypothetical protein